MRPSIRCDIPAVIIMLLVLVCAFTASTPDVRADFFQYVDRDGTVVMVDDESKIPQQYRKKLKTTRSGAAGVSRTTAVRIRNNQALVPVRLTYRSTTVDAWLLLDTGATLTMITTGLADRLGISPDSTEGRLSQVADGRVVKTFRTRVDLLAVGPKQKHHAEVAIMPSSGPDMGFDGLLGMNFLGEFRYHLDVNNQTIEWH